MGIIATFKFGEWRYCLREKKYKLYGGRVEDARGRILYFLDENGNRQ